MYCTLRNVFCKITLKIIKIFNILNNIIITKFKKGQWNSKYKTEIIVLLIQ